MSPTAPIGPSDGCILPGAVATRDCSRQTALDLSSMVRAIQATGLGLNLDPSRIYYAGQSFGSFYGTLFEAVDPGVAAGMNVGGGTQTDVARLSPIARQLGALYLSDFKPSLLNVPPAAAQAYFHDAFNDQYVYPGQVVTASVSGALAIQGAFEQSDWLSRGTQFADFEREGHFTARRSRTTIRSQQLNRGRSVRLSKVFRRWYPKFRPAVQTPGTQHKAA